MIIGIAGPYGAGKSEIVSYLRERSFLALSLSDVLRDELKSRGEVETRERMIELGTEVRRAEGADALARRLMFRMTSDQNYVVDSIRHPAEVRVFKDSGRGFRLVWVDANPAVRLGRIKKRGRGGDPGTSQDLVRLEGKELQNSDEAGQQLLAVKRCADVCLENEGSIEDLYKAVSEVVRANLYFERPGWDEYFMSVASVVASRSNCVKRKVAAVVTVDRRIVSTGYNGTPRGVRNCNEGGCPRCNAFGPGGRDLSDCLCSHGEENAITQAAYHGVSLRGATLYTTHCPCLLCTKMIINSGIREVVYNAGYPLGDVSLALLREADVDVRQLGVAEGGLKTITVSSS